MDLLLLLAAAIEAGTPLLLAVLGEIMTERVGNLNLGVEGLMLIGAITGFCACFYTGSIPIAIAATIAAGMLGASIYALLTVTFRANQVVTGLSLTIFGTGFSGFIGSGLVGKSLPDKVKAVVAPVKIPLLSDIPYVGKTVFNQNIFVYITLLLAILLGLYLFRTRIGLNLRAVGENPASADASGISVSLYKYVHILLGGALCALGGAYLSIVRIPAWQENVTSGRGWIAVALVIVASWSPYRAIPGVLFFGALDILGLYLQKFNIPVSQYLISMAPYIATIAALILFSVRRAGSHKPPTSLGNPYFREDR